MSRVSEILASHKPALLIGNGINRFNDRNSPSWQVLLGKLARTSGVQLSPKEMDEMSNTEFFDILDLAQPQKDRSGLKRQICDLMKEWRPSDHHTTIVSWAKQHSVPIITVNFDENLSQSVNAKYYIGNRFTYRYPWSSYFSDRKIEDPKRSFAIWHAHGMIRYAHSTRLGLRDYMAAVERTRRWVYAEKDALHAAAKRRQKRWRGRDTWLEVLFFCPLMIFGFGFTKDESFLRWLFLERARFHKSNPELKADTWFLDTPRNGSLHRMPFFESLGMEYVNVPNYRDIYQDTMWHS